MSDLSATVELLLDSDSVVSVYADVWVLNQHTVALVSSCTLVDDEKHVW